MSTSLDEIYGLMLGRGPDAHGRAHFTPILAAQGSDAVVSQIAASTEFQARTGSFGARLHRARATWVTHVPSATRLLDIGGSSPTDPQGGLIQLGYLHRPKELIILDRPPELQYWGKPTYDQSVARQFTWGTVSYHHVPAETLVQDVAFQSALGRFDVIFLGQVIEHIDPGQVPSLLRCLHRLLSPGGSLCLDTPNRLVTSIQIPGGYIDPDHTREYTTDDLQQMIRKAGFTITSALGILPLPGVVASRIWKQEEAWASATDLSADPSLGYCFGLIARPK